MYCQNCGKENGDNIFCTNCGTPLKQPVINEVQASENEIKRVDGGTYVAVSIVLILFNLLFGCIALANALQINKLQDAGDFEQAQKKAGTCKTMWIIGAVLTVLVVIGRFANGTI